MTTKNFKARHGLETPLIAADDGTTAITLSNDDVTVVGDLTVTSNIIKDSGAATAITLGPYGKVTVEGLLELNGDTILGSGGATAIMTSSINGDVAVAGDLTVTGNDIKSSSATAITLSNDDVTVVGDLTVSGGNIFGPGGASDLTIKNASTVSLQNDFTVFETDAGTTKAYFNSRDSRFTFNGNDVDNTAGYNLYSHGTFGTLGNATIGGDLTVSGGDITSGTTSFPITITRDTAATNLIREALTLRVNSTGTPAVGLGTALEFETETAASTYTLGGYIANSITDITPGSEDFKMSFHLLDNGGILSRMELDSQGDLQIDGDLTVTGRDITTGADNSIILLRDTASVASIQSALTLRTTTSGTPAVGIGTSIIAEAETAVGVNTQAGIIQFESTDITPGSESFDLNFRLRSAGVDTGRMTLDNAGNLQFDGDLTVTGVDISTGADSAISINRDSSSTNTALSPLIVRRTTSGTPAVGIGTGITFSTETASGNNVIGGGIDVISTDITPGGESFKMEFDLRNGGVSSAKKMSLDNLGNLQIDGDLTVTGGDITTGAVNNPIVITRSTALTTGLREALTLRVDSSGTPAVGLGTTLEFETETAVDTFTLGGEIASVITDLTPGAENFELAFWTRSNGSITERMVLDNAGNLQFDGDLTVGGNDIKSSNGTTALTLANTTGNVTVAGDLAVNGATSADITTTTTTATVFNTTATTLNIGGAATTMSIGNASGTVTIPGNLTVSGTTTTLDTQTLLVEDINITIGNVATPTDVTAAGGGITLLGATNKTITWNNATDGWEFNQPIKVTGDAVLSGDLAVNGATSADITTTTTTGTVFNTTATTVNIGGAATTVSIGANTGTTTVNNSLVADDISVTTVDTTNLEVTNIKAKDGTASMTIADTTGIVTVSTELNVDNINVSANTISSTNTNGNITLAPNGTGTVLANVGSSAILTRSSDDTDQIKQALILRVNSNGTPAIGIGTNLTFSTETAPGSTKNGGAILTRSTDITPSSEDFNMVFNVMNSGTETERMVLDNAGNLQIDGDLTVTGNDIKSSSATALTLSGADVTVVGDLTVNGGDVITTQTTGNLLNTTATTLNIGGAATTTNIGNATASSVTNVNNNVKLSRDGSLISGLPIYNGAANASTGAYDATRRFHSTFIPTITSASGTGSTATVFFTPVGALLNVAITGTAGQFSCSNLYGNTIFAVGDSVYIAGTLSGTGSITGYTNPTQYFIIATNGTTTFTLSATLGGGAITTTAGTTTGLTFSDPQYPVPFKVGAKVLVNTVAAGYQGVQTVTASTPNSVSFSSSATGTTTGSLLLFENIGVKGVSLSNANSLNQDTWLNFRTYGAESTNTPGGQSVIQYEAARGTIGAPLPNQTGDFLGAFYLQSNLGSATDASVAGSRFVTTAASGTGSVATLTYASIGSTPANVGAWITISGVVPTAYNGTYQVITSSTTQITYNSTATGSMTVPGFINILGSSTGATAGTTAASNFTTDNYRFPPQQFAFNATENHRKIDLGTFSATCTTGSVLTVSSVSTTATTAASGTGTVATLTFAANATASPPFLAGGLINIEGVTPTGYNGTYQVLSCTSTSVTFANTTTGSQTVAGTIKNYIFNGFQVTANTATTPLLRTGTPFILNQLTTTNANGLLGAEGTYTLQGVTIPLALSDTFTYSTMSAGMGMAFDQAAKSRVYTPSNRIRTLSLTPEITEFNSGQFGFSPQIYSFTDRLRLMTAITGGNTLVIPYHNLKIGDTISPNTGSTSGLVAGTAYYVATIVDVNNITLASDSALTTAVTGLTDGTDLNRVIVAFSNPNTFNLNLRNFRGGFNTVNGTINAIPNVLNDQVGEITFSGNRNGTISSPINAQPTLAGSSFTSSQIQTKTANITAQCAADWSLTSSPSKLVFATTAVSSVTPTTTLSLSNSSSTITSDTITLESSAGTDYAVFNSTSAKFATPVRTTITSATVAKGGTYTPAVTAMNSIILEITAGSGTTTIDVSNLTVASENAVFDIMVYNNSGGSINSNALVIINNGNTALDHAATISNGARAMFEVNCVDIYANAKYAGDAV